MPRRRKDRPIEELRETWTSTADLEETIAAMFPSSVALPASPPSAPIPLIQKESDTVAAGPADTVVDGSTDTVVAAPTDTVVAGPTDTVSDDRKDTVAGESPDTVVAAPTDTVAAASIDTVVAVSPDTVAAAVSDTVVAVLPDTVVDDPTDTVADGPTETVVFQSRDTVADESTARVSGDSAETVAVERTEPVVDELPNRAVDPIATVSAGSTDTVAAGRIAGLWQAEAHGGVFPSSRVRRITLAQDALTHAEESVYDVLWGPKNQNRDSQRFANLGYEAIGKAARVTKMNAKWIIERLIFKGFIRVETPADPLRRIPTKYLVYSYRSALENMAGANRMYVIRTGNGVLFAHPMNPTDTVAAGLTATVSVEPPATVPPGQSATVPPGQPDTVSVADTLLDSSFKAFTPSVVATAILNEIGFVDDDALKTLIRRCRAVRPDATDDEIAELGAMTARRIVRMRNIENPTGLLIEQTAKCFVGEPFAIYRRERIEREERFQKLYEE